jgi:hypothetical protein
MQISWRNNAMAISDKERRDHGWDETVFGVIVLVLIAAITVLAASYFGSVQRAVSDSENVMVVPRTTQPPGPR